ncbi:acyl-CoA carboxylase subunit beta [Syntrophus aciditrophicus]|uniref:Methylmalonyl-CoA decarboxylase, alpha-subunit n=1 Tax=Syntrophus aciditrophicus (strain SB) TaxID=56780 RepID=Q2LUT3_SYNAS|nr:acyl-CoA carboxylase subunit beta [Syntrophus aciditrophicus]ABC77839.1 methylmalonyl-CoA decarboxylase, alpha-subunit [Syntrophus aciditrophicus SB]OPY18767.1 MAG: Methylmalonyl-CoA carboxyltransferase 12S subunit [Syntrophus sp. PtaB.Bin075]
MNTENYEGMTAGKIREFEKRKEALMLMGGDEMIRKQHELGKLTARERLDLLFDNGSFQEVQLFTKHRSTLFGLDKKEIPADGVITGFGEVNGRVVFAAAQDFTCSGGSLGEMQAKKIWKVMDMAIAAGKPFVSLNDSGGARIQEGVPALEGYGGIFYRNTLASGYIPQITATMGPTAGGAVYSPALTDWIFMVKKSSYMCITGPDVIKAVIGEEVTTEALGGAVVHSTKSGVCHFATNDDQDCINKIRTLLSYLPDSCHSPLPLLPTSDTPDRECLELDEIIPDKPSKGYDMKKVILEIADNAEMMEPHAGWARNIIVAFIRIMGRPVGVIANNPSFGAGVLDVNASDKAARFIRFCDAFNIPLLTLADVPGYLPGTRQEWAGIITHGAKMLHAYSEATVPKLTVVIRKDYGGAYIGMCSKQLGADYVMAWPSAEIAVMGADGACNIVYRKEIQTAPDPAAKRKELASAYETQFNNPYFAAGLGIVDEIILPRETRKRVAFLLETFKEKKETRVTKKHNNIPL